MQTQIKFVIKATRILIGIFCFSFNGFCQTITGEVHESNGKPLSFVNVLLLNSNDSSLVKGVVTDTLGIYTIENIHPGVYRVFASMVGYVSSYSSSIKVNDNTAMQNIATLILAEDVKLLKEVVVNEKRPFVELQLDRMIVNVANSIVSSGSTALEVLEKSPGVTVDRQNDAIQFRGKEGVIVQIDGRQTYLPMADVVALLRSMPSDNIDQVELISNPSATNDAAGNSGIINIKLKKNKNKGTNGSLSLAGGSGQHDRERGSMQLNHRSSKFNFFGNYSINRGGNYWELISKRHIANGSNWNIMYQDTHLDFRDLGQNAKAGVDYVTGNTTFGIVWTGLWSDHHEKGPASTEFKYTETEPSYLETQTAKTLKSISANNVFNLNLQHAFGKSGGQLTADFDIGKFRREFNNTLRTETFSNNSVQPTTGLINKMPTAIDIYTAKVDYNRLLANKWKFETGLKSSFVWSDNDLTLSLGEIDQLQQDPDLSNHFRYTEWVKAAYVNFSGKANPKTNVQFGLRTEHTHSVGNSLTHNNVVTRNYLNLFPSLFVSHSLKQQQTLGISYSYRIDRPNYQSLNPARSYVDPFMFSQGNPFLQPQYTHSLELKHSYKEKIFTSVGATYTHDLAFFILQPVDSMTTERTPRNVGKSQSYNLTLSFPIHVMKGWNIQTTILGIYSQFSYVYRDAPFLMQQISARCNVSNAFILGKSWTAEITGWINTPSVNVLARLPWMGTLDAGIQKAWDPSWKVKLSFQDVFHTNRIHPRIKTAGFINDSRLSFDTQVAMLNVTYTFGNQKIKGARQRTTGSEEELKRTN